ncbi:MAG: hypothetical protein KGH63_03830 [Candidatus Micrarchaeota archaeon]|nr:hypothetical protein [Candidatus Micrarchaeota archaeon]
MEVKAQPKQEDPQSYYGGKFKRQHGWLAQLASISKIHATRPLASGIQTREPAQPGPSPVKSRPKN